MQHQTVSHPPSLFCAAASDDNALLAQWEKHLLPLKREGLLTFWSEHHLHAGTDRIAQRSAHLDQADCIVLLLSANFFASDECIAVMERALTRQQAKSVVIVPLLLRPVEWQVSSLGSLPYLPKTGIPITQWSNQDEAFHVCVEELCTVLRSSLRPISAPTHEEVIYRQQVVNAYNWLNFAGFGQGDLALTSVSLEDIFVRLNLVVERVLKEPQFSDDQRIEHATKRQQKRSSHTSKKTSEKRTISGKQERVIRVQEYIALVDALKTNLLLVGEPGAGKSILLRWLAITFAQRRQGEPECLGTLAEPDRLPILVELGQLPAHYLQAEGGERPNWFQLLPTYLSEQQPFGSSSHFITQALQTGHCLLLFDGLDEIAHVQARLRIAQSIAELARLFPQHRILVGSRPAGLSECEGALHGFHRCGIVSMAPEEVLHFLKRWYALDQPSLPQQQTDADALYTRLQAIPGLLELARTPLLCTILLLIWRNGQDLPTNRVEIYKRCCQILLTSWEHHHGIQVSDPLITVSWEQQLRLLAPLAYTIHQQGQQTTCSRKELLNQLKKSALAAGLFTQERGTANAVEQFLDWLALRSGLLQYLGNDQFRFLHQTFQEYLAAYYIAEQPFLITIDLVMEHLHESWWREVHLMTIGQLGSESQGAGKAEQLLLTILHASPPPWWLWRTSGARQLRLLKPGRYFPDLQWKRHIAWLLCREMEFVISGYKECHPETVFDQVDSELRVRVLSQIFSLFYDEASRAFIQSLILKLLQMPSIEMDVTRMLLRGLHEQNQDVREAAASSLGQTVNSHPEVVNALLEVLHDEYEQSSVRVAAASSLRQAVGSYPEVVNALLKILYEQDWDVQPPSVRGAAAISLGQVVSHYPEVLKALLEASNDDSWEVREAAVGSLGQTASFEPEVMKKLLKMWLHQEWGVSMTAARSLEQAASSQPGMISALLELLYAQSEDRDVREASAKYLGQSIGSHSEVTKTLLGMLHHHDLYMRKVAASSLGQAASGNLIVMKALLTTLYDQDEGIRQAAISSLKEAASSQPETLNTLLEVLHHQNKDMCRNAANSLEQAASCHSEVVDALLKALHDQSEVMCEAAANSLRRADGFQPEVINGLLKVLYARSEDARRTAAITLEETAGFQPKMIDKRLKSLLNLSEDRDARWAAARYLGQVMGNHREVAEVLLSILCKSDKQEREISTHNLEQEADCYPEVVKVLLEMLHDHDGNIHEPAANSLGEAAVSYSEVIEALLKALYHQDKYVRRAAAKCLGPAASQQLEVLKMLLTALHDQDEDICIAAISNMGPITNHQPEGVKALLEALHDQNRHVRRIAASSLGRQELHDPMLLLQIVKWLNRCTYDQDNKVRIAVLTSLHQLLDGRSMPS